MALVKEDVVVSSIHEATLVDGGPENYDKYATTYDDEHTAEKWTGYQHVVDKWYAHNEQKLRSGSEKHKVFDAGCGTGLVGATFAEKNLLSAADLYGGDLSPGMLTLAEAKNAYVDLKVVNLKEELPYDQEFFDSIVCAGVFLQGHCGSETIPHLMRVLKKGGYLIATARSGFYESTKEEWEREFSENQCVVIENGLVPYHSGMLGILLVIQKTPV